jgi:nicotinamidase/pyrazinamidase
MMHRALILVDLQNDFMPTGALPIPHSDRIIPLVRVLQDYFKYIIATQDWHPANHGSFASNHAERMPGDHIELAGLPQVLWPTHCVQFTWGAELVADLKRVHIDKIIPKGTDPTIDSYSGFFDNGHKKSTGLATYLKDRRIQELYILGLALEYCVKYTVLDSCALGFKTFLIQDACVAMNKAEGKRAIQEMQAAGAKVIFSDDILQFKPVLMKKE